MDVLIRMEASRLTAAAAYERTAIAPLSSAATASLVWDESSDDGVATGGTGSLKAQDGGPEVFHVTGTDSPLLAGVHSLAVRQAGSGDGATRTATKPRGHQRTVSEPSRLATLAALLGVGGGGSRTLPLPTGKPQPQLPAPPTVSCRLQIHEPHCSVARIEGLPLVILAGPEVESALSALRPAAIGDSNGNPIPSPEAAHVRLEGPLQFVLSYGAQDKGMVDAACACIGLLQNILVAVDLSGLGIGDNGAKDIAGVGSVKGVCERRGI